MLYTHLSFIANIASMHRKYKACLVNIQHAERQTCDPYCFMAK